MGRKYFLESELEQNNKEQSLFHVIPVPLEKSVSYGGGTAQGPEAIIKASNQLEIFNNGIIPANKGICTYKPIKCSGNIENVLKKIEVKTRKIIEQKCIPVLIGGEHTLTAAPIKAFKDSNINFGVVQFDAHADLRYQYEGSIYSHACVMRRVFEMEVPFVQIAVRCLSEEEDIFRLNNAIHCFDADYISEKGLPDNIFPENFPENIYITIDVDGMDPSIMPSTGTPAPNGLSWNQINKCLKNISLLKNIIGFDVVEFAPIKNLHYPDFSAAQLIYNLMGYMVKNERNR